MAENNQITQVLQATVRGEAAAGEELLPLFFGQEIAECMQQSERTIDRLWADAIAWLIRCVVKFLGGNPVDSRYEQNEHELFIRSGKDDIL